MTYMVRPLEGVLDTKLQHARTAGLRDDLAEVRGVEVHDGIAPVEVVQQIERLEPQLDVLCRTERNEACEREIDVPVRRSVNTAPLVRAERAIVRIGKGRRVEEVG